MYFVSFSRKRVTISSFTDESIQIVIETWADRVSALV
jgi:hypothetical protein